MGVKKEKPLYGTRIPRYPTHLKYDQVKITIIVWYIFLMFRTAASYLLESG